MIEENRKMYKLAKRTFYIFHMFKKEFELQRKRVERERLCIYINYNKIFTPNLKVKVYN